MNAWFDRAAAWTAAEMGRARTFVAAVAVVVVWAALGPVFDYSEQWQLFINSGTTIATFLAVFLIQSTVNKDTRALQLKLDELIRVTGDARDELVDLEDRTEDEQAQVKAEFCRDDDGCR
jgi:low affinity Fe/Cu permease